MKVRLNVATNPLQLHRKFLAVSSLIGVIAGIVCLALAWHVYSVRQGNAALRAKAAAVREEMLGAYGPARRIGGFFQARAKRQA